MNESLEKEIREVIKLTELEEFVISQKNNLDTFIGENGSKISGGQRQRIGIARALYNNPEILFLDEAMSNLDIENENLITKNIKTHHPNITLISISHHSQELENFDKIISIKDGKINEI